MLTICAVRKSFGGMAALANLSLSVPTGETLAVLGPSGCGKSTLLLVLAGLLEPDAGSVHWQGNDLRGTPPHRRRFGLMFQDYALFPHLNVFENVAFGLRQQSLPTAAIQQRVHALLEKVNLPGYAGRDPNTLSGGEQQRVALARALAVSPRLLMLDEPLGALDRALRERLLEDIRAVVRAEGLTTLYVTHDQDEAQRVADRVAVLRAGQLEQVDTPARLVEQPHNAFVAEFLGLGTVLRAEAAGERQARTALGVLTLASAPTSAQGWVLVRPTAADFASTVNRVQAQVVQVAPMPTHLAWHAQAGDITLRLAAPLGTPLPSPAHFGLNPAHLLWLEG